MHQKVQRRTQIFPRRAVKAFVSLFPFMLLTACTKQVGEVDHSLGNYPQHIGRIMNLSCALSGCHNEVSRAAAGNLALQNWDKLFEGSASGPIVIPYRPDLSTLCFYTNSSAEQGPALEPRMPL